MIYADAKTYSLTKLFDTDINAKTATYSDGTTSIDIPVTISYGDGNSGKLGRNADHASISVQKSDVPTPQYRDTFTIDGVEWKVFRDRATGLQVVGDESTWKIECQSKERYGQH